MNRKILWHLSFIMVTGLVGFFYLLHGVTLKTEEKMSFIKEQDRKQLVSWGQYAEKLYLAKEYHTLNNWLQQLEEQENTWVSLAQFQAKHIAGQPLKKEVIGNYHFGRSIDWKIHLYFHDNPIMELPFESANISLLIKLPERMRPGSYWSTTRLLLQIIIPMTLLFILSIALYRHIISPLKLLDKATSAFSKGDFSVRIGHYLSNRNDELSHLAQTFDQMASRIGELIENQRQLIADLSHELRTPLTRLDIAVNNFKEANSKHHLARITRESQQIRKLVEDTLTLAWLDNENPIIQHEEIDLVDLLDVLIDDARFEFQDKQLESHLPNSAIIGKTSHRALCPALENVIRNAMRYTPTGGLVKISLNQYKQYYVIEICDQGPGIPEQLLEKVFEPFFRVDNARLADNDSFGLGLALAKRHLASVCASISAKNNQHTGLTVLITVPINQV